MIGTHTYSQIVSTVKQRLKETNRRRALIGILFARPGSKVANEQIIPNINYFHRRSGHAIDIFCMGFGAATPDAIRLDPRDSSRSGWHFSTTAFIEARQQLESRTKWHYKGRAELILANAQLLEDSDDADLDFSSAIVCRLDQLIEQKAISSVEEFFEELVRFSESDSGYLDPSAVFSDERGITSYEALFSLVVNAIKGDVEKALSAFRKIGAFAVTDLSKPKGAQPPVDLDQAAVGMRFEEESTPTSRAPEPLMLYVAVDTRAHPFIGVLMPECQAATLFPGAANELLLPVWLTAAAAAQSINEHGQFEFCLPEVLTIKTVELLTQMAVSRGKELRLLLSPKFA